MFIGSDNPVQSCSHGNAIEQKEVVVNLHIFNIPTWIMILECVLTDGPVETIHQTV